MNDKTDKNEPGRFLGEGVSFRAKLIGVLEVPEARGDRMCQEALSDLKMAIRAAGEHKQRIQVHVAIDGLRLRDDKTGDSLYHHPVHKISFIAQDMTDSRAFGYIFGSPDTGHRFFGIKTDKAASQVVIAMRDLFQVVFELKKKEVEMAKQQLEAGKAIAVTLHKHTPPVMTLADKMKSMMAESASTKPEAAEGGVAELVDLEQELCSLRRGLTQVEELTPSTDPFGDSFVPSQTPLSIKLDAQKALLPPPPSGSSTRGRNTPAARVFSPNKHPSTALPFDLNSSDFDTPPNSLVDNSIPAEPPVQSLAASSVGYDVFTELDPLGTGKSKPYVDKKLFFQELKNPPKKVLKDLQIAEGEKDYLPATTMTSLSRHSGGSVAVKQSVYGGSFFSSDPFAETDPFDNADPFESLKDDPFTTMQEFPRVREELRRFMGEVVENGSNVFNGPLQVSLPPEPAPKSPRLQRQIATKRKHVESLSRPRPRKSTDSGSSRRGRSSETVSPPPPLPPKKSTDIAIARPPPRPPTDHDPESDPAPPLPRPSRKKEPMADRTNKPRISSAATNSSEDEYLSPAPPPLPAARRFDITLSQLLTCSMDELAHRLRVPAATLSSMTLPQLTDYLRSYLAADNDRAHIHIDTSNYERSKYIPPLSTIQPASPLPSERKHKPPPLPTVAPPLSKEFRPQFEDNFTPPPDEFVANFDDFEKKANASYDRYAAFREIQEEELKAMSILDPLDSKQDSDEKEEITAITNIMQANLDLENEAKEKSPLKSLDELTIDSFNMFRKSVSPKPIDAKIEDIKCVMKNLQIEKSRRSVSPRDNGHVDVKQDDGSDRYAALREITITEPSDEFESLPPEVKERKKSDEKSDGFDNSDFFDCIDNSSLSFTHVEDAFRKSPAVPELKPEPRVTVTAQPSAPSRLSTGSLSDAVSGSMPERLVRAGGAGRWAVLPAARSPPSSDSSPRRPVQTSSSSRDVSPWEEDVPPAPRLPRPPPHHRDRDSRHNSSGSRECLDSGSGREKDKKRDKRDKRDLSRDSRDSTSKERDHREPSHRRDRRSRERESEQWPWERDGRYPREFGSSRDRERERDYRDKERPRRHRPAYDDTDDYSDGGCSRSSSRDRWSDRYRREDRNYGSLGWRESRRRADTRTRDSSDDPRYTCTIGWSGRRSARREERERERTEREERERRRPRREERRSDYRFSNDFSPTADANNSRYSTYTGPTRFPFGADTPTSITEGPTRRDATDVPRRDASDVLRRDASDVPRRDASDGSRRDMSDGSRRDMSDGSRRDISEGSRRDISEGSRRDISEGSRRDISEGSRRDMSEGSIRRDISDSSIRRESTEGPTRREMTDGSRRDMSDGSRREGNASPTRFRFDSDSVSPRSMFEDDFTHVNTPRGRTASIAEEEESELPPLRQRPPQHRDIKKSESINIFTRESDPFEGDAFFACTGSDRAARRDNWPGDFHTFDNA